MLVADGGSKDKTRETAKLYDYKVVCGGLPARGRNYGAKYAHGKYLLFLDANVWFRRHFLEKNFACFTVWSLVYDIVNQYVL